MRRWSPVEIAVAVALAGTLAAVGVPAFVAELHASRFVEPVDGLTRIGAGAVRWADTHQRFPPSAPLTPSRPPAGKKEADAPGTWDVPAWQSLGFRPLPEGSPHAYAFSFDSDPAGTTFVARAHGDLDGDGITSTFEIRGAFEGGKAVVLPGMTIDQELE